MNGDPSEENPIVVQMPPAVWFVLFAILFFGAIAWFKGVQVNWENPTVWIIGTDVTVHRF